MVCRRGIEELLRNTALLTLTYVHGARNKSQLLAKKEEKKREKNYYCTHTLCPMKPAQERTMYAGARLIHFIHTRTHTHTRAPSSFFLNWFLGRTLNAHRCRWSASPLLRCFVLAALQSSRLQTTTAPGHGCSLLEVQEVLAAWQYRSRGKCLEHLKL